MRSFLALSATAAVVLLSSVLSLVPVQAQPLAAPEGVVNFSSSASVDVPRDVLTIAFSTTGEGVDATALQAQLKQALDAALREAKKVARPEQLEVATGNFSLFPRYANAGRWSGWQGRADLVVEGRDLQAISELAGRIDTMTIARVGYGLSRAVREKAEAEAAAQAIARYRALAASYAQQFGYASYAVRELSLSSNENAPVRPLAMPMKSGAGAAEEALPVEAGKSAVVVTVSGSIQMK